MSLRNSVVEYLASNQSVLGSIPSAGSTPSGRGPVAQLAEQRVLNPKVAGSMPVRPTSRTSKPAPVAQLVEHPAFNRSVEGSSPSERTSRESLGPVAQRTEHRVSTPGVEGLNPSRPSSSRVKRQRSGSLMVKHLPYKRKSASSILAPTTRRRSLCLESERIRKKERHEDHSIRVRVSWALSGEASSYSNTWKHHRSCEVPCVRPRRLRGRGGSLHKDRMEPERIVERGGGVSIRLFREISMGEGLPCAPPPRSLEVGRLAAQDLGLQNRGREFKSLPACHLHYRQEVCDGCRKKDCGQDRVSLPELPSVVQHKPGAASAAHQAGLGRSLFVRKGMA